MLKMPGGKKCEQRGEMRGCQRKEDRNSQASRGGPWQPLCYCSGKGASGPQRARSTGLPLEEGAGRQWALHQVGSVKVSWKCPVCSKTREGLAGLEVGEVGDDDQAFLDSFCSWLEGGICTFLTTVEVVS